MILNPFRFAVAGGGAAPPYDTAEVLGAQSTTGTTLEGAELTFTPKANQDYLFFWSQAVGTSTTSTRAVSDVLINNVSIFTNQPQQQTFRTTAPSDVNGHGGFFRYQAGPSPSATDFLLTGARTATAATVTLKDSRLSYIEMGADDEYSESIARQAFTDTTANKTAQTVCSLTWTPPSTGDYTVLAFFLADLGPTTNVQYGFELTDGTNTTGELFTRPASGDDRSPCMAVLALSSVSGSRTVNLRVRQTGTGTTAIGASECRIVAIRNDRFASVRSTILGSSNAGTDTSFVSALSQTFTPTAGDHLTFACGQAGVANNSNAAVIRYSDGAEVVSEVNRAYGIFLLNSGSGFMIHQIEDFAASSRTQTIERRAQPASSNHQVQRGAAIVTFELAGL